MNPAFSFVVEITLLSVQPTLNDPRFADFNSSLTLYLEQLGSKYITTISCGAPGAMSSVPVDIQIIQPTAPVRPHINAVAANYHSGILSKVVVSWHTLVSYIHEMF